MRIAVMGATGVLGQEAVQALSQAGHRVTGVTRKHSGGAIIRGRGGKVAIGDPFDAEQLTEIFRGHDVVLNVLAKVPVGIHALRPGGWNDDDRLHREASKAVAQAAEGAGVERLIQESTTYLYPDSGSAWITEDTPLKPKMPAHRARLLETKYAVEFAREGRSTIVLRLGQLYGRDRLTTHTLHQTAEGAAVLLGTPEQYITLLHHRDAGTAFVAALRASTGIYNVGGEPITRGRWATDLGREAGAGHPAKFFPELTQSMVGARMEDQRRSLRVSSVRFSGETGWIPAVGPSTRGWKYM